MLGGNLSTLCTYEFRNQLPVSPFLHVELRYPTLIDIHMAHKNPSHYSSSSFDQLWMSQSHSVYPEDVNLSYYKLVIGLHCRSLVATRILVRELSPRRRCLTHKNFKIHIIVVMSPLVSGSWRERKKRRQSAYGSKDGDIYPRPTTILNKYPFGLFEWSEKGFMRRGFPPPSHLEESQVEKSLSKSRKGWHIKR